MSNRNITNNSNNFTGKTNKSIINKYNNSVSMSQSNSHLIISSVLQYFVTPPRFCTTARCLAGIESTRVRRNCCGRAFHSRLAATSRSRLVCSGGMWRLRRRFNSAQTCSIGFKSGERAGQSMVLINPCCRAFLATCAVWTGALSCIKCVRLGLCRKNGMMFALTISLA